MLLDRGTSAGVSNVRLRLGEEALDEQMSAQREYGSRCGVDRPHDFTSAMRVASMSKDARKRVQRTPTQVTLHLRTALGDM